MKGKIIVGSLVYGIVIAVAYHIHNQLVQSDLYHFNYIVEIYIIPHITLYYANGVRNPIIGDELLALRIMISVVFWGGISAMVYGVWWATKTMIISLKTK